MKQELEKIEGGGGVEKLGWEVEVKMITCPVSL